MPPKLAYEPSVQSVMSDVLLAGRPIGGSQETLRRRVSWPVALRASGPINIEGGEALLVPAGRVGEVADRVADLSGAGVALVVLCGAVSESDAQRMSASPLPVVAMEGVTVNTLREELARYIARRRRELFRSDAELHHQLVDGAIGGASLGALAVAASRYSGVSVLVDGRGTVSIWPEVREPDVRLVQVIRRATQGIDGAVFIPGAPDLLAASIVAGGEWRGCAALLGVDSSDLDMHELVLTNLVSGCAIALGREPATPLPGRGGLAGAVQRSDASAAGWSVLAVSGDAPLPAVQRALGDELGARGTAHALAHDGPTLLAAVAAGVRYSWETVVEAVSTRVLAPDLSFGLSRAHAGVGEIDAQVEEALLALAHGGGRRLVRYDEVELHALLAGIDRAGRFVEARLAPLLDRTPGSEDLLRTLESYLRTGRNAKDAARELNVHRNTLTYRLRRLTDVLQIDWSDADTVFALDLALRLRRALSAAGENAPHSR